MQWQTRHQCWKHAELDQLEEYIAGMRAKTAARIAQLELVANNEAAALKIIPIIRQSARNAGKYRGKTHGRSVGTNYCKFLSSQLRVPDDGRIPALTVG